MERFEVLASGYGTVEGPTIDSAGNIFFSDISGGGVRRLSPTGEIDLVVPKRKGVGGICLHADGGIVVAGRDLTHVRDGESRTILSGPDFEPADADYLTSFNDITADDQGRIIAGSMRNRRDGSSLDGELLLVTGPGDATVLYGGVGGTNGLALDWDKQRLYHCNRDGVTVSDKVGDTEYQIADTFSMDGISASADGSALDSAGYLWVAFYRAGFVGRYSPAGEIVQRLEVPAWNVTSVCFVGPDSTQLIVVSQDNRENAVLGGCIFRTDVGVTGAPVGVATI